jgi:squalene cyclase
MSANYPDLKVIRSGIEFLMKMQDDKGDWPQQGISGVFNHNCMITYTAYRNVFPIWALARYTAMYETKK